MSLSVLNNFELCYRGTSFKVQGGLVIAAVFLAHNYVSEQFGNYVEYGMSFGLDKLSRWFQPNKLSLNVSKTNFMIFSNKKCDDNHMISINGMDIL